MLQEVSTTLPVLFLISIVALYIAGFILYPTKKHKAKWGCSKYYLRQKTCDFVLLLSSFWIMVYAGNRFANFPVTTNANASFIGYVHPPNDSVARKYKTLVEFTASLKDKDGKWLEWKERRKLLKQQIKAIRHTPDMSKGDKTLLIILCALLAIVLEIGVLMLSCSIACSGSGALAIFALVAGTFLVILLTRALVRSIRKNNNSAPAKGT